MATSPNIHSYTTANPGLGASHNIQACTRCGGLLIREGLSDLFDDTGHMRQWAWRCVQCGDIVDSLILKRRAGMDFPALNPMSRRRWTGIEALIKKPCAVPPFQANPLPPLTPPDPSATLRTSKGGEGKSPLSPISRIKREIGRGLG